MPLIVHNCVRVPDPAADVGLPGVPRDILYVNDWADPALSWWPKSIMPLAAPGSASILSRLVANWRKARAARVPEGFAGLVIADLETWSPSYAVNQLRGEDLSEFARACMLAGVDPAKRHDELIDSLVSYLIGNGCDGFDDFPHLAKASDTVRLGPWYFNRPAIWKRVKAVVLQNYWIPGWTADAAASAHNASLYAGRRCCAWGDARLIVTLSIHLNGDPWPVMPLDAWRQSVETVAAFGGAELNVWGECDTREKAEEHRRFMESGGLRVLEAAGWKAAAGDGPGAGVAG